jgi:rhamnosyltransferase
VVTYNPDAGRVSKLIWNLLRASAAVVVVDNSDQLPFAGVIEHPDYTLVALGENVGIARAQNIGVKQALAFNADVIVLFDQDSEPCANYLEDIVSGLDAGLPTVAAPVCIDRQTGSSLPSFRLSRFGRTTKVYADERKLPYPVDLVIASGAAATAATFLQVGYMDESLFIDFVDFEWCMRCRKQRVPIRVVPVARLQHSIGDETLRFGPVRGALHSPSRTYYKVRNAILLFRKPVVPFLFALSSTIHALAFAVAVLVVADRRGEYAQMVVTAIWHAFAGVSGKLSVD